ncbi:regulator of G protein signaling domain-containing protein [Ditylenchus destructor]|nr:regulator of G protein signaling domain-containing protein [Ditylenchus destructor]
MYNQNSSDRNWSGRLENVLNDYDALNLFKQWMGVDEDSSEHPIRLHFAIIAYKEVVDRNDPRSVQLAEDIYNKFLKQKVGLCEFIDESVREAIGRKVRQLVYDPQSGIPRDASTVFDMCLQQVDTFLRIQHDLFIRSSMCQCYATIRK